MSLVNAIVPVALGNVKVYPVADGKVKVLLTPPPLVNLTPLVNPPIFIYPAKELLEGFCKNIPPLFLVASENVFVPAIV